MDVRWTLKHCCVLTWDGICPFIIFYISFWKKRTTVRIRPYFNCDVSAALYFIHNLPKQQEYNKELYNSFTQLLLTIQNCVNTLQPCYVNTRRYLDVKTTLCAYWEMSKYNITTNINLSSKTKTIHEKTDKKITVNNFFLNGAMLYHFSKKSDSRFF